MRNEWATTEKNETLMWYLRHTSERRMRNIDANIRRRSCANTRQWHDWDRTSPQQTAEVSIEFREKLWCWKLIQLFKYVGKEEGSRKGPKREGDPKWGSGVTYHFYKRAKCYSEIRGEHTTEPKPHHKSDYHGSWRSTQYNRTPN